MNFGLELEVVALYFRHILVIYKNQNNYRRSLVERFHLTATNEMLLNQHIKLRCIP